jgi:hypothetical protein
MSSSGSFQRPEAVVRAVFATATVIFGGLGLLLGNGKLLVTSGLCGVLWTVWDVVWDRLVGPTGEWAFRLLTEGTGGPPPNVRPTLDDTIRLLENHLEGTASRRVRIQAAIRLEEIYRTIRKDPERARAVARRIQALYPDAPELKRAGLLDDRET